MSLFNQDNNSFLGIDRKFPHIVDWCQKCDYWGGKWVKSGTECSGGNCPHTVSGVPVGDLKEFREDPEVSLRCEKRNTSRWLMKLIIARMEGREI
jgi:hypothetical protein